MTGFWSNILLELASCTCREQGVGSEFDLGEAWVRAILLEVDGCVLQESRHISSINVIERAQLLCVDLDQISLKRISRLTSHPSN